MSTKECAGWTAVAWGMYASLWEPTSAGSGTAALATVAMHARAVTVLPTARVRGRPLRFLARVLGHAPRSLRHRIFVTPPPAWRTWTSLHLADAVCCLLWRWRSVHQWVKITQGSFPAVLVFVLIMLVVALTMVAVLLMMIFASFPRGPGGWTGGASSSARTATPPAALATRASSREAGTLVPDCTGARTSRVAIADWGRGVRPAARATSPSSCTRCIERSMPSAEPTPWRCDARLSALVAAVVNCYLAWAGPSSQTGLGGGRGGGEEARGA